MYFGLIILAVLQLAAGILNHRTVPSRVLNGDAGRCPLQEEIGSVIRDIQNDVAEAVQAVHRVPNCGDGLWYRVAYLNMSDPSQQCPSAWKEVTFDGIRLCGRPTTGFQSCPGTLYPVRDQYSRVCGRVIGYQFGSTDSFGVDIYNIRSTIDEAYVDGISVTHGTPRVHIWSYVAGASENGSCSTIINCPCSVNGDPALVPSYVQTNYYCESAYQGDCHVNGIFFPDDILWDGQQCDNEGMCCTGAKTPPWFSVNLTDSAITSDDIEVRICHNQSTADEDTPIQLLELYVQ